MNRPKDEVEAIRNTFLLIASVLVVGPAFVFVAGFVRPLYSISFFGLFLVWLFTKRSAFGNFLTVWRDVPIAKERLTLLICAGFALAFMLISGSGGVGFQHSDYLTNNTALYYVIEKSWPIWLDANELDSSFNATQPTPYVYYVGYFLPAGLAGKLAGWKAAQLASFLYTGALLWTIFVLISLYYRAFFSPTQKARYGWVVLLAFMFFASSDAAVMLIKFWMGRSSSLDFPGSVVQDMPMLFTSHFRVLTWIPQHGLQSWLVSCFLLHQIQRPSYLLLTPVLVAASFISSPFSAIGQLPLIGALFFQLSAQNRRQLVSLFSILIAVILFGFEASFILSNNFSFPILFLPNEMGTAFLGHYLGFLLTQLGISGLILAAFWRFYPVQLRWILGWALGTLVLLPLFQIGVWNDSCARASIPALFVVGIAVAMSLAQVGRLAYPLLRWGLVLLFLVNTLTPLTGDAYLSGTNYQIAWPKPQLFRDYGFNYVSQQRLGNPTSFFFRHLARKPANQPDPKILD